VDINPKKQGRFVPGVGKKIVPPEFLSEYRPDLVIVVNSIYVNEIGAMLNKLGLNPDLMTV
jgi:hypothetical protein